MYVYLYALLWRIGDEFCGARGAGEIRGVVEADGVSADLSQPVDVYADWTDACEAVKE